MNHDQLIPAHLNGTLVPSRRRRRTDGYTMVEMMLGLMLAGLLLAGIITTYIIAVKGYQAVSNYREIHAGGRKAVDRFTKDIRGVNSITSFTPTNIVMTVPVSFDTSGVVTSNKTITYTYDGHVLWRYDSSASTTDSLATNIYSLTFTLFDHVGSNTTLISSAKGIQLDIKLRKLVISQIQSEDYLGARLDMRNK